jgi:hypothetical protein
LQKSTRIHSIILIGLLGLFLVGMIELFQMRFQSGDIYPVYSSLRTDPLGTKAYYDALAAMPGLSVTRNYKPLPKLESSSALFLLGVNRYAVDFIEDAEVKTLESFISGGGRLVMTFLPSRGEAQKKEVENKERRKLPEKKRMVSLAERWGFRLSSVKPEGGTKPETVSVANNYQLPASITWHSIVSFDVLDIAWETIYQSAEKPVMIERRYGKGTIVLATDTYFVSNEAILKERHSDLLAWLAGPQKSIIFDETHNGIFENPGVTSLFRKYGLHGVFAGFLILGVLFIWKNSISLVPRHAKEDDESDNITTGRDHLSGFISLLRRNVPPREVLSVCVQEWKKGLRKGAVPKEKIERIEKEVEAFRDRSVKSEVQVDAYKSITKILSERLTHGK